MLRWLRRLAVVAFAVCLSANAYAQEVPRLQGRVNDYANILSPADEASLEATLANIETYPGHPQVVILTTPSLGGEEMAEYSLRVARAWELGQAELNNGLLIVIAPNEREIRFEVGYGLEGAIPDAMKVPIIDRRMRPHLAQGEENYAAALTSAVEVVDTLIRGEATGDPAIDNAEEIAAQEAAKMGIIMVGAFIAWIVGYMHWGFSGAVGAGAGVWYGLFLSASWYLLALYIVLGAFGGILAHFMIRAKFEGGGGSYAGSGGSVFRGGGGGFGGGGFGGRF